MSSKNLQGDSCLREVVEGVGWTAVLPGGWLRRSMELIIAGIGVVRIFLDGFPSKGNAAWVFVLSKG
jgi:hypothetical protein